MYVQNWKVFEQSMTNYDLNVSEVIDQTKLD